MEGYLSFLISALDSRASAHHVIAKTMPIYEYRCTQCSHKLEALQKFSDAPLSTCPACGKEALSKLVSAAGFQLKGSGWYQTDFRGGGKPAAKVDGDATAKPDAAATPAATADSSASGTTSSTGSDKGSAPSATPSPPTPTAS